MELGADDMRRTFAGFHGNPTDKRHRRTVRGSL
jgi:hypothetical protein